MKNNICHKVRRTLVPGTLQVHEMKGFGAVEIGVHRFHQPAVRAEATGEAQFIHLWQNKDGAWQITRVISYDHRARMKREGHGARPSRSPEEARTRTAG